jgi:cyanophycin synthetase
VEPAPSRWWSSKEEPGRLAFSAKRLIRPRWNGSLRRRQAVADLRELDEDERLGPSTGSIVDAAVARGIPFRRLTRGSLVQFGWGSKQRRIQAAEVDSTSAVAESIGQDKDLTKRLLHAAGVPVPLGRRWTPWKTPGPWPKSACPWWSSRRTATRARA